MYDSAMLSLKEARQTVESVASQLQATAADTRAAVLGAVALGGVALVVALIALALAKGKTA
jgi:hypothetical protein